jgi:hypothetical protein
MASSSLRQPNFQAQAYSDDGYRRKQCRTRLDPATKAACKLRANCLKPKEIRKAAQVAAAAF